MKKYSLKVDDKTYEVRTDGKLEDYEDFQKRMYTLTDGTQKEVGGMPKVWADNLDKVVETDITQELATQKTKAENLAMLQDLLSEPEIAVELEAKYRAILAEKRGGS